MAYSPEDLVNETLDLIGYNGEPIGDLNDGSHAGTTGLRAYEPMLRLLLRSAPWNFARKSATLTILQDATGNTPGVGINTPPPFVYEYLFPTDGVKIRFVPWLWPLGPNATAAGTPASNIAAPSLPNFPVPANPAIFPKPAMARFQVAYDDNLPNVTGDPTVASAPDWASAAGQGPYSKRVVLCDVPPPATAVYTALTLIPETWDATFREAFVELLAARLAVPILTRQGIPHSQALQIAAAHAAAARDRALEARAMDNNEALGSVDHVADWVRARRWGGYRGAGGWGYGPSDAAIGEGFFYSAFDTVSFPGLAAF